MFKVESIESLDRYQIQLLNLVLSDIEGVYIKMIHTFGSNMSFLLKLRGGTLLEEEERRNKLSGNVEKKTENEIMMFF